jgi:hypothetical protein
MPKQIVMKGIVPPLSVTQEYALTYLEAERAAKDVKDKANKRKDEMIASALKVGIRQIKVKDAYGYLHTFDIERKNAVKHTAYLEVRVEKVSKNSD